MKLSGLILRSDLLNSNDNPHPHPLPRVWIVLADQKRMHLYGRRGADLVHLGLGLPEGNEKPVRGRSPLNRIFSSCSRFIRHSLEPSLPPKIKANENFARKIADWLYQMQQQDMFDKIIITAPPAFLGILRRFLPAPMAPYIIAEIDKDLMKVGPGKLKEELKSILWFPTSA